MQLFVSLGLIGFVGIFRTSHGFVKGCFVISIGIGFAFEAKLAVAIYAILFVWKKDWHALWLETDSTYLVAVLRTQSLVVPWHWHLA